MTHPVFLAIALGTVAASLSGALRGFDAATAAVTLLAAFLPVAVAAARALGRRRSSRHVRKAHENS